ncbi:MAG: cysteine synthase A [Spirochaetes bacterium]|nr:cysteine synthase A [Spirochaetota bacterium]
MKIAENITDLIGKTPLLRINRIDKKLDAELLLKLEFFNPMSSIKDRIAYSMIKEAEDSGVLSENPVIIEPTSGNTGIALAYICASKGYRVILTMPDTMSVERQKMLRALGAELVLTPGNQGMNGAILKAQELVRDTPGSFMPMQFNNKENPEIHKKTTGPEIWEDTGGNIDIFVAGVGTGGTITGAGAFLKEKNPAIKIVAVEPAGSPVLSGEKPGKHKIQGIGAGFIPEVMNLDIVDEIIKIGDEEAGETARLLAKKEGIMSGISTGANICASLKLAQRQENKGKVIVTIACDTGERYLSTWLFNN